MKIRRYMAKNAQEAMLKVKMDLGNEAVILNTRKVKKKGLVGLFSKPLVEVLAAIDEYGGPRTDKETPKASEKSNYVDKADNKINFDEKEEKIAKLENKILNIEGMLQKIYTQLGIANNAITSKQRVAMASTVPKITEMFYDNLLKNEVDPVLARKIIESAASKAGTNSGVNDLAALLQSTISSILGRPDIIKTRDDGKPTIIMFVGPTGVGKTTTLAKIAANYLLNQKKAVGLITTDTYRIAAVEQLKTYAEILGIPLSVVYTANEIKDAMNQHSDKDIILIDTAGRSHKNKSHFDELKSLVMATGADEIYLVLSATTSIRNCREILNHYSFLANYKLIFTKLDEAPVQGIILNVKYYTGKSLSYITTGQSVPDDIETANVDKIAKNLIGSIV